MPLLDLGAVSRTLMKVIDLSVNSSPAWPPLPAPKLAVVPHPPDRLTVDGSAGLYLYHFTEDPEQKNRPALSGSDELRFMPMALSLYYVLSAHVDESDVSPLKEQLIMGLAAKALRDHPIIDDNTAVAGTIVLDPAIRNGGNRLRIYLQPIPAAEAVSYWTAGSLPLRLSAYYQVSVVLLEPDVPPFLGGRVLRYGIQIFVSGAPRLEASQSVVTFRLPGETTDRTAIARPAQVTQVGAGDEFTLLGTGLTVGPATLLLRPGGADTPIEADEHWGLQVTVEGAFARARLTASGTPLLPGTFGASVRVSRVLQLPGGGTRVLPQTSNEVPLVIAPGIQTLGAPNPTGQFTITGTGFAPAEAVDLYASDAKLVPGNAAALAPGEFAVQGATQIDARLPAGLPPNSFVPVRIIVSGSESPPAWVQAP
jgi:Pvc16 N-terminal domain